LKVVNLKGINTSLYFCFTENALIDVFSETETKNTHTYTHTLSHTQPHTYTHTHTHTNIHTHTHTHKVLSVRVCVGGWIHMFIYTRWGRVAVLKLGCGLRTGREEVRGVERGMGDGCC